MFGEGGLTIFIISEGISNIILAHDKNYMSSILPGHLDAGIPRVDGPRPTRSPNSLDLLGAVFVACNSPLWLGSLVLAGLDKERPLSPPSTLH